MRYFVKMTCASLLLLGVTAVANAITVSCGYQPLKQTTVKQVQNLGDAKRETYKKAFNRAKSQCSLVNNAAATKFYDEVYKACRIAHKDLACYQKYLDLNLTWCGYNASLPAKFPSAKEVSNELHTAWDHCTNRGPAAGPSPDAQALMDAFFKPMISQCDTANMGSAMTNDMPLNTCKEAYRALGNVYSPY